MINMTDKTGQESLSISEVSRWAAVVDTWQKSSWADPGFCFTWEWQEVCRTEVTLRTKWCSLNIESSFSHSINQTFKF